jgi:hypothetical protein
MKTDELIALLATGTAPVDQRATAWRFGSALGAAAVASTLLMAAWLGVRSDLAHAFADPMLWVKLAFPALLAAGGLAATLRLGHPGAGLGRIPAGIASPVLALWALAVAVLLAADPARRAELLLGDTWYECPFNIVALGLPVLVAALWAIRGLAPTRLRLAGTAAGLLAGALGALVYALHCPEMAAPFLAVWYVAGIALAAGLGALAGPRLLRW